MSRLCTEDQSTEMSYEDIILTTHTHQGMSRLCTEDQSTEMSYEDIVLTTHTLRYAKVFHKSASILSSGFVRIRNLFELHCGSLANKSAHSRHSY